MCLRGRPLTALRAFGTGDREVARRLFITEATVKTHLVRVYGELGVDPRTAAVTADGPPWRRRLWSQPACTFGTAGSTAYPAGSAPSWSAGRVPVLGGPGSR
ncbi:LuxR C-terminal-related transcriptional regulator [Streptosporangium sp. CA-115845]|uniref:LuxR C-terminal-related transcriptional regulator n=1 Tax=Streptosporangium sp. CA-115845 TaxID=3240071 RepID=UPI003D8AC4F2